jgi:hypothetical protein
MYKKHIFQLAISIFLGILLAGVFFGIVLHARASVVYTSEPNASIEQQVVTLTQNTVYMPTMFKYYPLNLPFGVESTTILSQRTKIFSSTVALQPTWVRLNGRVSWRSLQLEEGGPIQWDLLVEFEGELRLLRAAGITPIVIVNDFPRWATDDTVRKDGQPTSCGRLLDDKVDEFASFMVQLVNRYKTPEFGVQNWEIGNEPDVDPDYVPPDNVFGCWGDTSAPYYGGEIYGRMIIHVGAAIKAADPAAKVWIGGLLLGFPSPGPNDEGHQEKFFEGILRSGAAPYFDVVPYHWYPSYAEQKVLDFDLFDTRWSSWGGGTVGKARFLRQVMQEYGVSKPVFLNETAFGCPYDWAYVDWCQPPSVAFFDLQASYVVRAATRAYNAGITGYIWYPINGPALRWWGLLDGTQSPKPVYQAYQLMINHYHNSRLVGPVSYGEGIEAYTFDHGSERLDVLWSIADQTITVTVPITDWIGASGRDGEVITPTVSGTNFMLPVGFSPVYLELQP